MVAYKSCYELLALFVCYYSVNHSTHIIEIIEINEIKTVRINRKPVCLSKMCRPAG